MNRLFFYGSITVLLAVFFTCVRRKRLGIRHMIIMMGYSLYNLIFELVFGEIFDLYYYMEKACSLVYIIVASVFLYPLIAVLYVLYLPTGTGIFSYTLYFITGVLLLELIALYTRTIVFTGWKVIPWSVVTYIISFGLIYAFNRLLIRTLPDP